MAATWAGNTGNWAENRALAARLSREITGEVLFDSFNRGRYATDASFYQIVPAGVVIPRNMDEGENIGGRKQVAKRFKDLFPAPHPGEPVVHQGDFHRPPRHSA